MTTMTSNTMLALQALATKQTVALDLYAVWSEQARKKIGCQVYVNEIQSFPITRYRLDKTWASGRRESMVVSQGVVRNLIPKAYQVSIVDDTNYKHAIGISYDNKHYHGDLFATEPKRGRCIRPIIRETNLWWGSTADDNANGYWY